MICYNKNGSFNIRINWRIRDDVKIYISADDTTRRITEEI